MFFFFQAEDGIRDRSPSRGLGDVYKRQILLVMAKVIHIHLTHGIEGTKRKDWYFSSITAIYTVLTAEQVGATKNYLLHAGLSGNGTVCTKKAIIKQSTLISCGRSGNVSDE